MNYEERLNELELKFADLLANINHSSMSGEQKLYLEALVKDEFEKEKFNLQMFHGEA